MRCIQQDGFSAKTVTSEGTESRDQGRQTLEPYLPMTTGAERLRKGGERLIVAMRATLKKLPRNVKQTLASFCAIVLLRTLARYLEPFSYFSVCRTSPGSIEALWPPFSFATSSGRYLQIGISKDLE